jgi:hypothetical protein
MSEQFIQFAWRCLLQSLLACGAIAALCLAYLAMTGLFNGQLFVSASQFFAGAVTLIMILWIARHREELVVW